MLTAQENTVCQTDCFSIVNHLEELSHINAPEYAAVIWQRSMLADFQSWIDKLSAANLPNGRMIIHPDHVRKTLEDMCNAAGTPECPQKQMLIDDVVMLADKFTNIISTPFLRLRLDAVTTNACKKFHIDYLKARLVCTYRGTGTQYGVSMDGLEPQSSYFVPTSSPLLMKGAHWQTNQSSTFLHRSPQIEGSGQTRLVLVLDPVDEKYEESKVMK